MMDKLSEKPTFAELCIQHEQVFKFQSSMGEITLKRLSFVDSQRIISETCAEDNEYAEALERLGDYQDLARDQEALVEAWKGNGSAGDPPEDFPHNLIEDRRRVRMIVSKYNYRLYGPCFVNPPIGTRTELMSLIDNLEASERNALVAMLSILISGLKDLDKNKIILGVAKKYGIPWAPGLFLSNMTLQQFQLIAASEMAEAEAAASMIEKMKK